MLSRALAADDPPVLHLANGGDGGDTVTHGIAEGNSLDLVDRAEPGECAHGEIFGSLPRKFELSGLPGKPHGSCAVINPDKHSSNAIAWMTY